MLKEIIKIIKKNNLKKNKNKNNNSSTLTYVTQLESLTHIWPQDFFGKKISLATHGCTNSSVQ